MGKKSKSQSTKHADAEEAPVSASTAPDAGKQVETVKEKGAASSATLRQAGKCYLCLCSYEGGLEGLSCSDASIVVDKDSQTTEFAFAASDAQIACCASNGNVLAIAGHEEVIKLFNLRTKRTCGELSGVHECTIRSLDVSTNGSYVFSGGDDGQIGIWRVSDGNPLHTLKVKNTSKVVSLSVHKSDRMLLALYANGMLRLWNLLDARCIFKKKAGLATEDDIEDEDEEDQEADKTQKEEITFAASAANSSPEMVRWEASQGNLYAVLFNRMLEIYSVEAAGQDDQPIHSVTFDTNQTGFDFVSPTDIVVSDEKGRLTLFQQVDKPEEISMQIVETGLKRIKQVNSSPDFSFFSAMTSEGVALWDTEIFREELAENKQDLMLELEPHKLISRNQRLTCSSVTILKEPSQQQSAPKKKTSVMKSSKKIKKANKKDKKRAEKKKGSSSK